MQSDNKTGRGIINKYKLTRPPQDHRKVFFQTPPYTPPKCEDMDWSGMDYDPTPGSHTIHSPPVDEVVSFCKRTKEEWRAYTKIGISRIAQEIYGFYAM